MPPSGGVLITNTCMSEGGGERHRCGWAGQKTGQGRAGQGKQNAAVCTSCKHTRAHPHTFTQRILKHTTHRPNPRSRIPLLPAHPFIHTWKRSAATPCSCALTHTKHVQLGIPTANLPVDATATPWIAEAKSGVYFGWAALELPRDHPNRASLAAATSPPFAIFPMVMSIGYNPFYNNTVRSAEVHVLERFGADFYGVEMRLLIVGYIRDEQNYDGLDALIEDINTDCEVARKSLARDAWKPAGEMGGKLDSAWLTR